MYKGGSSVFARFSGLVTDTYRRLLRKFFTAGHELPHSWGPAAPPSIWKTRFLPLSTTSSHYIECTREGQAFSSIFLVWRQILIDVCCAGFEAADGQTLFKQV